MEDGSISGSINIERFTLQLLPDGIKISGRGCKTIIFSICQNIDSVIPYSSKFTREIVLKLIEFVLSRVGRGYTHDDIYDKITFSSIKMNRSRSSSPRSPRGSRNSHSSDLMQYTVVDLKKMAKDHGLKGYSKLNKQELVDMLRSAKMGSSYRSKSPSRRTSPMRVGMSRYYL